MPGQIRVVELIKNFSIESGGGGIERFGISLAQALNRLRFQVTVCGLWNMGTPFERERMTQIIASGLNCFTAAPWNEAQPYKAFWQAYRGLQAWITQNPVDILHCHSEFSDMAVLPFGLRRKPTIIRTVHNLEWRKRPLRRILLTNFLYPLLFHTEIGVSQAIMETLNQRPVAHGLHRQARCIHNAVDLERFANVAIDPGKKRLELGLPLDAPVVGSVGRLTRQKGFPFLVDAAARVLEIMPQARFVIVGDGEDRSMLHSRAESLGLRERVVFTGARSDVAELLTTFDLFVSSSLWEGLPTVIMESMAAGVPVVATDIPGTRELALNEAIGWLVEAGNEKTLGEAILLALGDPARRAKCAKNARQVVQTFSIQTVAAEHETLYTQLVGNL
jgi:glycosyltransferase involved in cell wall biosynthesis